MRVRRNEKIIFGAVLLYFGIYLVKTLLSSSNMVWEDERNSDLSPKDANNDIRMSKPEVPVPVQEAVREVKPEPPRRMPKKIVILTYMRSGSSFIGDILQRDPGVFYLFEPLRMIQHSVRANQPILFQNGSWSPGDNFLKSSARTFEAWLDCRPEDLGIVVWDDGFLTSKSNRAKVFHSCFKEERPKRTVEDARTFCTQKIKEVCLSSANIVTKIIRMPMYIFDESLQKYPDMKIVHLIRDPRPTLLSQKAYGNFNEKTMSNYLTRYCNRVLKDVLAAEFLEKKYPGRIFTLFYEDLAKYTVKVSKKLYSFTGLEFTKDVELYIRNITKGKPTACDKGHGMCTTKSNSAALAEKWRDIIDFKFVQEVDSSCKNLLYELRLKEIPNLKKLRDKANFHLTLGPKGFDDFRWS